MVILLRGQAPVVKTINYGNKLQLWYAVMKPFQKILVSSLCGLFLLSGCRQSDIIFHADSAVSRESSVEELPRETAGKSSLRMLTPIDGIYVTTGMGTQEGYYLLDSQANRETNIKYIDFATKQLIYLSSDVASAHDTPSDTSWIEQNASFLFVLNEMLYCVTHNFDSATVIYEMSLTGSNRRVVLTLPDSCTMTRGIATDEESLYTTLEYVNAQAQQVYGLYQLSLETGEISLLEELGMYDFLYGADGEYLYFKSTIGLEESATNEAWAKAKSSLKAYSLKNHCFETVCEWPARSNCGAIDNGYFYTLSYADGTFRALDLTTRKTRTIVDNLPNTGGMDGIYFDAVWDGHFVYRVTEQAQNERGMAYKTYGIDLDTGDCACITLSGGNADGEYVPILWETDDQFLLQYGLQPQQTVLTAPDGSQYASNIFALQYALIDKSDFWQNVPNYQQITNVD